MKSFFNYLLKRNSEISYFISNKVADFIWLMLLYLMGVCIGAIIITIAHNVAPNLMLNNNFSKESLRELYSPLTYFLLVVLIGPLLEELIFRLFLKGEKIHLKISLCIGVFLYGSNIIRTKEMVSVNSLIALLVAILVWFGLEKEWSKQKLLPFIKNNVKFCLHLSAILFAVAHFKKMGLNLTQIHLFPIVLFSYYWGGLVFGFYRMKNGFIFSLIGHIFINLLSYGIEVYFLVK